VLDANKYYINQKMRRLEVLLYFSRAFTTQENSNSIPASHAAEMNTSHVATNVVHASKDARLACINNDIISPFPFKYVDALYSNNLFLNIFFFSNNYKF
jgi:hypothetical protein